MTPAQRREGRAALAMLPVGGMLTIGSGLAAIGFVVTMLLGLYWAAMSGSGWRYVAWLAAGAVVAVRNTIVSIEIMSAFVWRPVSSVLLLWALVLLAWPGWLL